MKNIIVAAVFVIVSCTFFDPNSFEPETLVMPAGMIESFEIECARLAKEKPGGVSSNALGRDGWCYQVSELKYGAAGQFFGDEAQTTYPEASGEDADPLTAILDFKNQLALRGIELVFIPIPVRPVIYPEGVIPLGDYIDAEPLPHLKPMQDEFLEIVAHAGVDTINLSAYFLANRHHERGALYCKSDTHWTPSATSFAAQIVGRYLKSRPWYEAAVIRHADPAKPFTAQWRGMKHFGHCYRKLRDFGGIEGLPSEELSYREISGPAIHGENGQRLRHPGAPVVILGDSNMILWHDKKAGFPQELTFELGFHVDTHQSAGGGINQSRLDFVREIRNHPEYRETIKAVIWIFTARAEINARPWWIKTEFDVLTQEDGR